jgi:hypothetical protein
MLAGVVGAVLLLSFGATWLATDQTPAAGNGTLPLRSKANGGLGAELAKGGPVKAENPVISVNSVASVAAAAPSAAPKAAEPVVSAALPAIAAKVEPQTVVSPPPNRVVRTPVAPRKTKGSSGSKGPASNLENPYQ